jgi:hypothetical protein
MIWSVVCREEGTMDVGDPVQRWTRTINEEYGRRTHRGETYTISYETWSEAACRKKMSFGRVESYRRLVAAKQNT